MLAFFLGLFGNLLAAEFGAWCPHLADKLIAYTAKRLPASLQERMLEEWSALLDDTHGDLSKLLVAVSLYWKRSKIADQCQDTAKFPIPSLIMDSLSDMEDAVFEMTTQGMTVGEISNFLNANRTAVEYYKLNCAQKLSGQTTIGRMDVVTFLHDTNTTAVYSTD
jgi:regulatory LuxR family protein